MLRFRILISFIIGFSFLCVNAQVMEWVVKPKYKEAVPISKDLYKVKGADGKWGVYNVNKRDQTINAEYDSITCMVEGRALVLDKNGQLLYGIIDEAGNPVKGIVSAKDKPNMLIMREYPYYSEGLLPVGVISNSFENPVFGYFNKQGDQKIAPAFIYACPFNNGQAMVRYEGSESFMIIDQNGGKLYSGNDKITFLSNPHNGELIWVSNRKVLKARLENKKFKTIKVLQDGKRMLSVDNVISDKCINVTGDASYRFDNAMHLIEGDPDPDYTVRYKETATNLSKNKSGWQYSICRNGQEILPAQFKDVYIYDDEFAVVTDNNGNAGILRYNPTGRISVEADSKEIVFAHNEQKNVPIHVNCYDLMNPHPQIELKFSDNQSLVYNGTGHRDLPFYEKHTKTNDATTSELDYELIMDGLKVNKGSVTVQSSHKQGFSYSSISAPKYTDVSGEAEVNIVINAIGGTPSAQAKVTIDGQTKTFKGSNSVKFSFKVKVPVGDVKTVSYKGVVTEDGCPSYSFTTESKTIEHISRQ